MLTEEEYNEAIHKALYCRAKDKYTDYNRFMTDCIDQAKQKTLSLKQLNVIRTTFYKIKTVGSTEIKSNNTGGWIGRRSKVKVSLPKLNLD